MSKKSTRRLSHLKEGLDSKRAYRDFQEADSRGADYTTVSGNSRMDCPDESVLVTFLNEAIEVQGWLTRHLTGCTECQQRLDRLSDNSPLCQYRELLSPSVFAPGFFDPPIREGDLGSLDGLAIEAQIGLGGMGVVYRGRDERLGRLVAIKILRQFDQPRAASRFQREVRAAGRLEHDHVVPVFSTGHARDGRPYLVMPLVGGQSLRERVVEQPLDPRDSARIVREIALGLTAAHAAGLIHRDVKPANILLDRHDQRAKLTDFGLARTITDETLTQANVLCGTPEYMSPEQIVDPDRQDPRGDIYSLGITLYECLTGTPPFRGKPLDVLEQHRVDEPQAPSRLNRRVPRDLETICLKSIAKDPARRYQSASEFAVDLQHWLRGEPIAARPPGRLERASRFVARHRGLVVSASLITTILLVGIVTSTWFAIAANEARVLSDQNAKKANDSQKETAAALIDAENHRREAEVARDEATLLAARAKNTLATFVDSFKSVDPNQGALPEMLARDLLVQARHRISQAMSDDLVGKSQLLNSIAGSLSGLGEYSLAAEVFAEALELSREGLGDNDPNSLLIMSNLGTTLDQAGQWAEANPVLEQALQSRKNALGPKHLDTLTTMVSLVANYRNLGQLDKAFALGESTVELCQNVLGENHQLTSAAWVNLAAILSDQGAYDEASLLYQEVYKLNLSEKGPSHLDTLSALHSLAANQIYSGKKQEAVENLRELLQKQISVIGEDHWDTVNTMGSLSVALRGLGQWDEALVLAEKVLKARQANPSGPELWIAMGNLANLYQLLGRNQDALTLKQQAYESKKQAFGPEHPSTLISLVDLSSGYQANGNLDEAEKIGREALDLCDRVFGPKHANSLMMANNLSHVLSQLKKTDEALALNRKTLDAMLEIHGEEHLDTALAMSNLASLLIQAGQLEEALELQTQVVQIRKRILGEFSSDTLVSLSWLARLQLQMKRFADAKTSCWAWCEGNRLATPVQPSNLALSQISLAEAQCGLKQFEDAQGTLDSMSEIPATETYTLARKEGLQGLIAAAEENWELAEPMVISSFENLHEALPGMKPENRWYVTRAAERVIEVYSAQNKTAQAAAWEEKIQMLQDEILELDQPKR